MSSVSPLTTSLGGKRSSILVLWLLVCSGFWMLKVEGNPDAKRLYDDLLSSYNRLIRPVENNTDKITVKMRLRLSQLIELVCIVLFSFCFFTPRFFLFLFPLVLF